MGTNKCLVTKLKATVNNDSLPKLDELILNCTPVATYTLNKAALKLRTTADNCVVRIIGDGYFVDDDLISNPVKQVTLTKNTNTILNCSNGTYKIGISNKSDLYLLTGAYSGSLGIGRVWSLNDLSDIQHCTKLTYFNTGTNSFSGNIESDLQYLSELTSLNIGSGRIEGSVSKMAENMILNGKTRSISSTENNIASPLVTIRDENQEEVSFSTWKNGRFRIIINSPSSYSIILNDNSKGLDYNLVDGVWVASEHIFE